MDPLFSGGSSSSWTAPPVAAYSFLASNPNYIVLLLVATLIPLVLFIENIGKDPSSSMNDMAVAPIIPDFKTDIKVDNEPPSKQDLEKIAELPVLDKGKNSRTFKSLYADNENGSRRVLVIFVRHFFCGMCQEFIKTLSSSITPSSLSDLASPTEIVVIGCGEADMISHYTKETSCPFPVYTDPTRKLYHILGMTSTLGMGGKAPEYMQKSLISVIVGSFFQELRAGRSMLRGGDFSQVGGEFMFEEGKVTWCHRMKNTRDHAEIPVLRTQLRLDGSNVIEAETPRARKRNSIAGLGADLGRRMSNRRQSWGGSRSRSRNNETTSSGMEGLKEEGGEEKKTNGEKGVASGTDVGAYGAVTATAPKGTANGQAAA
ncbi:hypothetical protein MMC28_001671 [Mycoblastus sanguinarius]|nr:hypothetical protein [Mycoblastus sanguinarius]